MELFSSRKMIVKKTTASRYTLVWSKLYSFVDTKIFMIRTYNPVEQLQITDTDFIVTTDSG